METHSLDGSSLEGLTGSARRLVTPFFPSPQVVSRGNAGLSTHQHLRPDHQGQTAGSWDSEGIPAAGASWVKQIWAVGSGSQRQKQTCGGALGLWATDVRRLSNALEGPTVREALITDDLTEFPELAKGRHCYYFHSTDEQTWAPSQLCFPAGALPLSLSSSPREGGRRYHLPAPRREEGARA